MDREKVIKRLTVTIQSDSEAWDTVELPIKQAEEILALLKEQEEQINQLEYDLAVTQNNLNYYLNGND